MEEKTFNVEFLRKYPQIYLKVSEVVDDSHGMENCADRVIRKTLERIEKAIDKGKLKSNNYVRMKYLAYREIIQARKERKLEIESDYIDDLAVVDKGGDEYDFEIVDEITNVENLVVGDDEQERVQKTIATLACNDRERFALNLWAKGLNNTQIASGLASRFGGKAASYRVWLTRFKERCELKRDYVIAS